MSKILAWIKTNLLTLILLLVVIYVFRSGNSPTPYSIGPRGVVTNIMSESSRIASKSLGAPIMDGYQGAAPTEIEQRMIVQDTSLSMQVKEVSSVMTEIERLADGLGGYMVSRNMNRPEGAATGNITIRVPVEKREEVLTSIKKMGIKTVSESVSGRDVTDQYVDIQGRIDNLNKTKVKMEALQEQAVRAQDLLDIQIQINNIQSQIDSYIGQQKYLEQTAKLTRISVSLSTDELALPYAPDAAWRPGVVLKMAVRSMVGALRSIANAIIWLVIYVPILLIVGILYWLVIKVWRRVQGSK